MSLIRTAIRKLVFSNDLLFKGYYSTLWKPRNKLDKFLNQYSRKGLVFIQVGANDGLWNDPIYKFIRRDEWRGILVEPQKDVFVRLSNNYKNSKNLVFENVAIGKENNELELYRISFTNANWATGLSSFNKEDVQRMIDAGYVERMASEDNISLPANKTEWITTENVETIEFKNLISKHRLSKIDLLTLDVEGYEFEILETIPFQEIKINVIIYEHTHFKDDKKQVIEKFLISKNYTLFDAESDTIAITNNLKEKYNF